MSEPVNPVDPVRRARRVGRRAGVSGVGRAGGEAFARLAAPHGPAAEEPAPAPGLGPTTYAAQVLGEGERRGLKGGPETLDRARNAYLETEWSGPSDRRHARGKITKTEI
jgi:hypothetical protein